MIRRGKGERKITINVVMDERWVNDFLSMLKLMENLGKQNQSLFIGFFSNGGGDFKPRFEFDCDFEESKGYWRKNYLYDAMPTPSVIFDAGIKEEPVLKRKEKKYEYD